jgi:hypothetical protein
MRLFVAVLAVLGPADAARAGAPAPGFWDNSETIFPLGDLPAGVVAADLDKVGFKYRRYKVLGLPFWTSDGEFVAYRSGKEDDPWKLSADANKAAEMTGLPVSTFRSPWWYSVPPGWLVLGGVLVAGYLFGTIQRWRDRPRPVRPAEADDAADPPARPAPP